MEFENSRIIDSNGTKYRVGWDQFGWFSIQTVAPHPEPDAEEEWVPQTDQDGDTCPVVSFPPDKADDVIAAIKDKPHE